VHYVSLVLVVATFAAVMFVTAADLDRGLTATLPATLAGVATSGATLYDWDAVALAAAIIGLIVVVNVLRRPARRARTIYLVPGGAQGTPSAPRSGETQRFVLLAGGRSKTAR
jgi:type II secretory pathway component PulF